MIARIKATIERWRDRREAATTAMRKNSITDSFNVEERGGSLFLMHNGEPVRMIGGGQTADLIVTLVNEARHDAMSYYGLLEKDDDEGAVHKIRYGCAL